MRNFFVVFVVLIGIFTAVSCSNTTTPTETDKGEGITTFTVATIDDWNSVKIKIASGGNNKNYIIKITDNIDNMPGSFEKAFGVVTGITVTISGDYILSLQGETSGSFLYIGNKQTVVMQDTDLKGNGSNGAKLVSINGGTFIMQGNASLSGNNGGGVRLSDESSFNMKDNTSVFGNMATYGGGVWVDGRGVFTMEGNAAVFGNTASIWGGGILINGGANGGVFRLAGGTVVGDNVYQGLPANSAPAYSGTALYVNGSAQVTYGGTDGTSFNIPLYNNAQNNTITHEGVKP